MEATEGNFLVAKRSGLQTAWLLATLGSKLASKKSVKNDILNISIRDVCQELASTSRNHNIRHLSQILYGISLVFKSQIGYLYNDIALVNTRLRKEYMISTLIHRKEVFLGTTSGKTENNSKGQIFLKNDPLFNIHLDLNPFWGDDDELSSVKKRRIEIRKLDQKMFPNTYDESMQPSFGSSSLDTDQIMFTNLMNQDFNTSHNQNYFSEPNNEVDFEFNREGNAVNINQEPVHVYQDVHPFDFEMGDLNTFPPEEEANVEVTKNITNDPNFHISTTENIITIDDNKRGKRKFQFLTVDARGYLKLTKSEMLANVANYEKQTISKTSDSDKLFEELVRDYDLDAVKFVRQVNEVVLGKIIPEFRSHRKGNEIMHNISKDIEYMQVVDRMDIADNEHEIAREVRGTHGLRNAIGLDEIDIGAEDMVQFDYDNFDRTRDSILNLSFGDIDDTFHSRYTSRGTHTSTSSAANYARLRAQAIEEDSEDVNSQVDYKLFKFFNFLKTTVEATGDGEPVSEDENHFRCIKFSLLIPNINSKGGTAVSRKLAANSFASVLALTTRNMMKIQCETGDITLSTGSNIMLYVQV
jgi:hypothetical protein